MFNDHLEAIVLRLATEEAERQNSDEANCGSYGCHTADEYFEQFRALVSEILAAARAES